MSKNKIKSFKEWKWTHFIVEAFCLYEADQSLRSVGVKPPKGKPFCNKTGQPELDKCWDKEHIKACPHFGYAGVDEDERKAAIKAMFKVAAKREREFERKENEKQSKARRK